jgi:hypothetical protein
MRIQDAPRFSLELLLPERVLQAMQHQRAKRKGLAESSPSAGDPIEPEIGSQAIIESLDRDAFGGPSFGPHTMALMSRALDELRAELAEPVSDDQLRRIAAAILTAAADGERDVARLKAKAFVRDGTLDL